MTGTTETSPTRRPPRNAFWTAVETLMIVVFLGMLAVMFIQVVARYALAVGVPWTDETARFLYISQIFIGASVAQRYGEHIRITMGLEALPPGARRIVEGLGDLLTAAVAVALLAGSILMIGRTSGTTASTLPITMAWVYGAQALGVILYILLLLKDLATQWFGRGSAGEIR